MTNQWSCCGEQWIWICGVCHAQSRLDDHKIHLTSVKYIHWHLTCSRFYIMFSLFNLSTFDSQITLYYDSFQNHLIFKLTLRFPRNYVFKQYIMNQIQVLLYFVPLIKRTRAFHRSYWNNEDKTKVKLLTFGNACNSLSFWPRHMWASDVASCESISHRILSNHRLTSVCSSSGTTYTCIK